VAYVIKQRRRTSCPCGNSGARVTPGAALRAAGFFQTFPTERQVANAYDLIQPERISEPFYDGPCGTEESVPCCCQSNDFYPTYAYFTQLGSLELAAGEAVPFTGPYHLSPSGVRWENGVIVLAQAGTYRASYMVRLPASAAVETTFYLSIGGIMVPGSIIAAQKSAGDSSVISVDTIITIDQTTPIGLVSTQALSFADEDTLATLTLHRIA